MSELSEDVHKKPEASCPPNCQHYTPAAIAAYLVKPLVDRSASVILDPSFGNGALIRAYMNAVRGPQGSPLLMACDINPPRANLFQVKPDRFWKHDFLLLNSKHSADIILMNPPFVRHHHLSATNQRKYCEVCAPLLSLASTSDLWGYFLVKALSHLKPDGSIGAILPWSFLQAEFARDIRELLANRFGTIIVLALQEGVFEHAKERVCLVWLKHFGRKANRIKIASVKNLTVRPVYEPLTRKRWLAHRVVIRRGETVSRLLNAFTEEYGAHDLGEISEVKIGVVTGADQYFIVNHDFAVTLGFKSSERARIINTLRGHGGLTMRSVNENKVVLSFNGSCDIPRVAQYIRMGENSNFHLRSHSLRRKPWYKLRLPEPPDAFFPYRATMFPYSVINDARVLCTNSVHALYFHHLSERQQLWLQISLLSAFGQLSLEANSKTYGEGVMKIEPSALKKTPIFLSHERIPSNCTREIDRLLQQGEKHVACILATDLIQSAMGIPQAVINETFDCLRALQSMRVSQ